VWDRPQSIAALILIVPVDVVVDVIGPLIVAVHVHGNDTVIVIRPVDETSATAASTGRQRRNAQLPDVGRLPAFMLERAAPMLTKMIDP